MVNEGQRSVGRRRRERDPRREPTNGQAWVSDRTPSGHLTGREPEQERRQHVPAPVSGLAVLLRRPNYAPAGDVGTVVLTHVLVARRDIGSGSSRSSRDRESRRHVHRQAGYDGLGGENPAEAVRAELGGDAVAIGELRGGDQLIEQL